MLYQYVEYVGEVTLDKEMLRAEIEKEVNRLINLELPINVYSECTEDKIKELCGEVPEYVKGKQHVRVISMADSACPCGGTHVSTTKDIGTVTIKPIKKKSGKEAGIRVSYNI